VDYELTVDGLERLHGALPTLRPHDGSAP
jgi:hypothetical protein